MRRGLCSRPPNVVALLEPAQDAVTISQLEQAHLGRNGMVWRRIGSQADFDGEFPT